MNDRQVTPDSAWLNEADHAAIIRFLDGMLRVTKFPPKRRMLEQLKHDAEEARKAAVTAVAQQAVINITLHDRLSEDLKRGIQQMTDRAILEGRRRTR